MVGCCALIPLTLLIVRASFRLSSVARNSGSPSRRPCAWVAPGVFETKEFPGAVHAAAPLSRFEGRARRGKRATPLDL